MREFYQTLAIVALAWGLAIPPEAIAKASRKQTPLDQAKEYAFASCIYEKYKGEPLSLEVDAWASGIIENGSLDINIYLEISKLTKKSPSAGTTQLGVPMKLQGCFNYVNSPEFEKRLKQVLVNKK
jgi:hypothetical protein